MICRNCGNYIDDDSVYCPYCNIKVGVMPHQDSKKGGGALLILGWLFFIFGIVGAVASYIAYDNTSGKRAEYWFEGKSSKYEVPQLLMYVCIGAAVIGLIMIIIGYVIRGTSGNKNNSKVIINPPPFYPQQPMQNVNKPAPSAYEKLEKLKKLLDAGAITQEEFESKKAELLKDL